jgi:hypothetical protein
VRRHPRILLVAAVLGAASVAFAATLGPLTPSSVGSTSGNVNPCDTDGFTITYTTSRGNVTQATIGGIKEPACAGGSLSLALTDASGASIGSGGPVTVPTTSDPGSVSVPLAVQPYAGNVAGFQVVIVGP